MTTEPFISAHADPEGESPWALQVVVKDTKDFGHLKLSYALASATIRFLDTDNMTAERKQSIECWMQGRIRKIVRRAKNSAWTKAVAVEGETYSFDGLDIHLCTPMPMDSIPKDIARAQVSELHTEPNPTSEYGNDSPWLKIYLNRSLDMSAGKAAVAAAHAAQLMAMKLTSEDYEAWKEAGYPLAVSSLGEITDFVVSNASVSVHDGGLTEVEPGSVTSIGIWTK